MSVQSSIRLALLSVLAICGCSTGTSNVPVLSMNPFAAASAGSTATKPPTQYSLSLQNEPKQRSGALDWFRRSGAKTSSFTQATPNPQMLLNAQSMASHRAPLPVYSQPSNTALPALAHTYQPSAPATQTAALRGPFANPGDLSAAANVSAQYSAAAQYMPPAYVPTQHAMTSPHPSPVSDRVPPQYSRAPTQGVPMQPTHQYSSAQYPSTSATPHSVPAQYSTASQYNAPQYTPPTGSSGSTLR